MIFKQKIGCDKLSKRKIERNINGGCNVLVLDKIDSTNTEMKRRALDPNKPDVIVANTQTSGRGRLGRSFFSPSNTGIYMSMLAVPKSDENILLYTTATAVAVCLAIEKLTDKNPLIKWVNDIYIDGKKVCGILAEAVTDEFNKSVRYIIIGIGINWGDAKFPDEICEVAGSVCKENERILRNAVIAEIINEFRKIEETIFDKMFIEEYRKRSMVLGKKIVVLNTNEVGVAEDIDENGALVITLESGESKTLSTGEISIRIFGNTDFKNNI